MPSYPVKWALERLGCDDVGLSELLAPAQLNGVCAARFPDGRGRVRQIYDYDKVSNILIARGFGVDHLLIESLTYCDGTCEGCVEKDGRGCSAIALFHAYATETGGAHE